MLKSLIRTLLSSFRESHRSVPQTEWIAQTITVKPGYDNPTPGSYTAPSDGWFVLQVNSSSKAISCRKNNMDWTNTYQMATQWPVIFIPCRKGETVVFFAISDKSTVDGYVRFYKNVGE